VKEEIAVCYLRKGAIPARFVSTVNRLRKGSIILCWAIKRIVGDYRKGWKVQDGGGRVL